jgi:hypothetical protein
VNPLLFVLVLILAMQAIAFVIAIVARLWVLRPEPFVLSGIDVERATNLIAYYVGGVHDHRFGFPTGVFEVDEAQTSPGRLVAREMNFKGSAGMGPIRFGLTLPLLGLAAGAAMGDSGDEAGCLVGALGASMGFMLGAAAAAVLIVPFAFLAVVEVILRTLMQGQIDATIQPARGVEDAVEVRFELRGLSAFGVEHQLRRGMSAPQPGGPDAAPDPAAAGWGPGAEQRVDRLNAIYLSAISVGLIASIAGVLIIGNAQTSGPGGEAQAGYYYEEEEPSYESGTSENSEYGYGTSEPAEEGYASGTSGPSGYGYEPHLSTYQEARQAYLEYWRNIAVGDYAAAYGVYYRTFATQQGISRSEFVEAEYEYSPRIKTSMIHVSPSSRRPTSSHELWLYAEVPISDGSGEFAGICRLFYGDVRMFRAEGTWYYRPGVAFGRSPSFGNEAHEGGIKDLASSSPRCV